LLKVFYVDYKTKHYSRNKQITGVKSLKSFTEFVSRSVFRVLGSWFWVHGLGTL